MVTIETIVLQFRQAKTPSDARNEPIDQQDRR